jgi:hypothetical protein
MRTEGIVRNIGRQEWLNPVEEQLQNFVHKVFHCRKCGFGAIPITPNQSALDEEQMLSGQSDPWKQLWPLVLQAASKYAVDGVEQLPRKSNECL